jgi:hypothetical protein
LRNRHHGLKLPCEHCSDGPIPDLPTTPTDSGLSTATIVGASIGAAAFIALVFAGVYFGRRKWGWSKQRSFANYKQIKLHSSQAAWVPDASGESNRQSIVQNLSSYDF